MATSNELIRDEIIRHEIELLRFKSGFGSRLQRILNRAEPNLRSELKARLERAARIGFDTGPATTKRLAKINLAIQEIQSPTWATFRDSTREELTELGLLEAEFMGEAITGTLPVIVDPSLPTTVEIRRLISKVPINGTLLKDWLSRMERGDRARMMAEIREGILFAETPVQISRRIFGTRSLGGSDGVREITRRGALAMAQTSSASVSNAVKQSIFEKNKDIIDEEVYVATLDSRTSPQCRSLDGKRFEVGEGPVPPVHVSCRSTRVPVFDGESLGFRPANATTSRRLSGLSRADRAREVSRLVGQVPAETTYSEFLSRQSAGFQNDVLGKSRAVLFRKGGVSLDQFVDATGRQYNLVQLRSRIPKSFESAGL